MATIYPKATSPLELGIPAGPSANVYFVDPANGDDDNTGLSPTVPLLTLTAAEDKCVANQHDTVALIADESSISLTATLTWDKSYTHLVGLCAPTFVGQRSRIFAHADNDDVTPLINVTASGCIFRDLYVFNGVDDAGCLVNVQVTGGRNYFRNVHFAGGGHATSAIDGGASLSLNGAEECLFEDCTIGVDTIAAATGMMGVIVDGDAKRCAFRNCRFTMYAGNSGAGFVEVVDSAGFDRYLLFEDCLFLNDAVGTTMASGFMIPAGMGSVTHRIILRRCGAVGITDWDASDRGLIYACLLYTSPSPRDRQKSRMPSSA
jgi:hypothetical protein